MRPLFVLLCLFVLILRAQNLGSPAGLMSDSTSRPDLVWSKEVFLNIDLSHHYVYGEGKHCPGMNKNTTLSESTKSSLYVVLVYPSSSYLGHTERKCPLSEEGAQCVADLIDLRRRTQVIISGYMASAYEPLVRGLASPYLDRGRNVIVVEIFPVLLRTYPLAARLTKPMGTLLGEFLAALTRKGLRSHRLGLLGVSLGAHIASRASHVYQQLTGRRPARLTGLDPAGPCFRNLPRSERFNPEAAHKVDALHTNIDGFGLADPVAHVDFYANGGEYQPSMKGSFLLPCFQLCSHVRSVLYWINAHASPDKFVAVRCASLTHARRGDCYYGNVTSNTLGPKTNFNKKGIYFLPTSEKPPYYIGKEALTPRLYGSNHYLLKTASDDDVIV